MPKASKERNSVINFRINKNINPKTLDMINEYYTCGKQAKLINDALKLYCTLAEGGDVLGLFASLKETIDKSDTALPKKKPGDNVTFRLSQDLSDNVIDAVNNFYKKNLLTYILNVSLELYRVLKEINQSGISPEHQPQETPAKKRQISENTIRSLRFLRNIQKK